MADQFIEIDGKRLECAWFGEAPDGGDAAAPVLVFLHDALGCVATWRRVPEELCRRTGLRGFAYSRAGYGRSDAAGLPFPLDYHDREAHDVLPAVLDAAGIGRAVLVGHSDGGTLALMAAAVDQRIEAVVTMAGHVINEDVTIAGVAEAGRAWQTTDMRARLARYHGDNVDIAFRGWRDTWLAEGFRDWDVRPGLAGVACPVLVIQDPGDEYGTVAQVEAIAEGVSGPAEILLLDGCGHFPHLGLPDRVLPAINHFIARTVR